jgi:phosphomannomutase
MGESPLILGVSGLRGIVGESLTPEVAVRYAAAFGSWLQDQIDDRKPYVVVGDDGRDGNDSLFYAVISALLGAGCRVCIVGTTPTPTVGFACDLRRGDAAVIVTASHNPQEWNGVKILLRRASWKETADTDGRGVVEDVEIDACAPDAMAAADIIKRFQSGDIDWWAGPDCSGAVTVDDIEDPHCMRVLGACERVFGAEPHYFWEWFEARLKPRIVIDSVNASGGRLSRIMFASTPCDLIQLHGKTTGVFPHTPEPTRENLSGPGGLCDVVPGVKADVGFAQDPDADRLAIVDETGRYIGEEYTLVLAAEALLGRSVNEEERAYGKPVIVVNLSTSRMIEDVAAKHGAEVVRTAVGEANVVERMKALKAEGRRVVMGGEGNGGVIWPEVTYVRDSLSAMALTLGLMARTGKTVSQLVADIDALSPGGKGYAIVKRKVEIARKEDAQPAVEAAAAWGKAQAGARVDLQDGCRVDVADWNGRGAAWVHVRASNTEPIMRLIAEAGREEDAVGLLAAVEGAIRG